MKNLTYVLLFGVLGLLAWKVLKADNPLIGSGATSPSSNPLGTTPGAGQPAGDLFNNIVKAVTQTMATVQTFAQSAPKTN